MGEVIDFRARLAAALGEEPTDAFDKFLIDEGLDLLANFRSITDPVVRLSIRGMLAAIARSSSESDETA